MKNLDGSFKKTESQVTDALVLLASLELAVLLATQGFLYHKNISPTCFVRHH